MSGSTVSADPNALFRYADKAADINRRLDHQARLLADPLQRFASTCTEYAIGVGPELVDDLEADVMRVTPRDEWVREVGQKFLGADQGAMKAAFKTLVTGLGSPYDPGLLDPFPHVPSSPFRPRGPINPPIGPISPFPAHPPYEPIDITEIWPIVSEAAGSVLDRYGETIKLLDNLINIVAPLLERHGGKIEKIGSVASITATVLKTLANIHQDIQDGCYGGDNVKIVGVNLIDGLATGVIGETKVGGVVLAVNAANQLVGTAQAEAQRSLAGVLGRNEQVEQALRDDADRLESVVKRQDLGRLIKVASENIYENKIAPFVNLARAVRDGDVQAIRQNVVRAALAPIPGAEMATAEGRRGNLKLLRVGGDIIDSVSDKVIVQTASARHMALAAGDNIVQGLPLPQGLKRRVSQAADAFIERSQAQTDRAVDTIDLTNDGAECNA